MAIIVAKFSRLTDELDHFVLQKVESGRYENASEGEASSPYFLSVSISNLRPEMPIKRSPASILVGEKKWKAVENENENDHEYDWGSQDYP